MSTIAAELGLAGETIRRWTTAAGSAMSVRPVPVEVVTEPTRMHSVISPSGFRVEGLTLDEAAALLRALR